MAPFAVGFFFFFFRGKSEGEAEKDSGDVSVFDFFSIFSFRFHVV